MKALILILSLGVIAGKATPQMASPSFWASSDSLLMTPAQIAAYNAGLKAEDDLDLVDIFASEPVVSGAVVRKAIEAYTIPPGYGYIGTGRSTRALRREILAARNLAAVPSEVKVRCAVVCTPADLRSFPTALTCTDDGIVSGSLCFDDFQQTQLWLGEGVLVWHESADGKWYFVRGRNYAGWVKAEDIGLCSFDEMSAYVRSRSFAVTLEQKLVDVAGKRMRLMMGTRLCCNDEGEVLVPVRLDDGSLGVRAAELDIDLSRGYLPYTLRNVMKQAFRLLGTEYSWGGAGGFNDCSATLLSVYYCFGIDLPRNSSSMRKMDRGNHYAGELPDGARAGDAGAFACGSGPFAGPIDYASLQPGSLAVVPGHAMMFLGVVDGEVYILHDVNALYRPAGGASSSVPGGALAKEHVGRTIVSSTSDLYRKTGLSFLDSFVNIIEVR